MFFFRFFSIPVPLNTANKAAHDEMTLHETSQDNHTAQYLIVRSHNATDSAATDKCQKCSLN